MASKGQSGAGAVLSIGGVTGTTGTETFVAIGDITDAPYKDGEQGTAPSTNLASTTEEIIPTLPKIGTVQIKGNRVANDAGQLLLVTAKSAKVPYDFKLQLPINKLAGQTTTGDLIAFSAYVLSYQIDQITPTTLITFTSDLSLVGQATFTSGS